LVVIFSLSLVLVCLVSLLSGPATSWTELVQVFSDGRTSEYWNQNSAVFEMRLVHVFLASGVGFALASGGRAMQLYLQNPLADPHVTGLSAGSTSAVLLSFLFLPDFANSYFFEFVPAIWTSAFLGALLALFALQFLYRVTLRRWGVASLALVGLLVNAICAAALMVIFARLSPTALSQVQAWTLGAIQGHSLMATALLVPLMVLAGWQLIRLDSSLRLLSFGAEFATAERVDVLRVRKILFLSLMILSASTVCAAGSVGFVGLLVPHFTRRFFGGDSNANVRAWLNALAGAILVVVADLASRTLTSPLELPVGVYTALLASPFLLIVMVRQGAVK
jgi:iron complex transport system permease protein